MKYTSTRNNKAFIDFESVSLKGVAPDGGLYLPKDWHTENFRFSKKEVDFESIAFAIIKNFVGDIISNTDLREIIRKSYTSFSSKKITPLKQLEDNHWLLEC